MFSICTFQYMNTCKFRLLLIQQNVANVLVHVYEYTDIFHAKEIYNLMPKHSTLKPIELYSKSKYYLNFEKLSKLCIIII